jgi:5-(carboxyamino)imidazole ribonucleotide synthase
MQAWSDLKGFSGASTACVLEKLVPLDFECSIVLARNERGDVVHLPIQRNIHRDGILALTRVHEGCIPDGLTTQIVQYANSIAKELEYVGVLCIEFFVLKNSNDPASPYYLMVNEIAPRPHNSGHYSVESCDISQFELQVRCLTHLPLIMPRQHSPALMLNLLGDLWFKDRDDSSSNAACEPDWSSVLSVSGINLSLYGKVEPRRARKMGHITITAPTISELYDRLHQTTRILGIVPFEDL